MRAYIDTTVLTNALLKDGASSVAAKSALARYTERLLPTYAIKELKAGPLFYHAWWHNKLALAQTFSDAVDALHRMSRTPRRYQTSTALESLIVSSGTISAATPASLVAKYGPNASMGIVLKDEIRIATKNLIFKAWAKRKSVATAVVQPLACYLETDPIMKRGLIDVKPVKCSAAQYCCLGDALKARPEDLEKLRAVAAKGLRQEDQKRAQALRSLVRKPKVPLSEGDCRSLGDALFAFFAPSDCEILTTNLRDHSPLAASLNKHAVLP